MSRQSIADHIPGLRRYARALTADTWAADDLVQDTLERACGKWSLWLAGSDLRAWLFTLMHNIYANHLEARYAAPAMRLWWTSMPMPRSWWHPRRPPIWASMQHGWSGSGSARPYLGYTAKRLTPRCRRHWPPLRAGYPSASNSPGAGGAGAAWLRAYCVRSAWAGCRMAGCPQWRVLQVRWLSVRRSPVMCAGSYTRHLWRTRCTHPEYGTLSR